MNKIYSKLYPKVTDKVLGKLGGSTSAGTQVINPEELLVYLPGRNDLSGTSKVDTWIRPERENFVMSQAPCIETNGVDSYGESERINTGEIIEIKARYATDSVDFSGVLVGQHYTDWEVMFETSGGTQYTIRYGDGSDFNYVVISPPTKLNDGKEHLAEITINKTTGVVTVTHDGVTRTGTGTQYTPSECVKPLNIAKRIEGGSWFAGKIFDLTINGVHFPIAETSGLHSFSTDGQHTITWTGVEAELRAGRQDTYFYNDVYGFGYRENLCISSEYVDRLSKENITASINYICEDDTDNRHYLWASSPIANTLHKVAVLAKAKEHSVIQLAGLDTTNDYINFDLANGIISKVGSDIPEGSYSIVSLGDGWYMCTASITSSGGGTIAFVLADNDPQSPWLPTYVGDGVSGVYLTKLHFSVNDGDYIETTDFTYDGTEKLPFLNEQKGNTFNNSGTSFAPESFPAAYPNGVDQTVDFTEDHGTIVSYSSVSTSTPTYSHPTLSFTAGSIKDLLFSDGTLVQFREGSGYDLHDSLGNVVGTLSGDETFWDGPEMVSDEIIKAEAVQGTKFFTDGNGHPLPMKQSGWEELGEELVFDLAWEVSGATENVGTITIDDDYGYAEQVVLIEGHEYECVFTVSEYVSGIVGISSASTSDGKYPNSNGTFTYRFIADGSQPTKFRLTSTVAGVVIGGATLREVNQTINHNKQYYLRTGTKTELAMYSEVQDTENDTKLLEWITS